MSNIVFVIGGLLWAGCFGWAVFHGFQSGRMWIKNRDYASRVSEPRSFWLATVINIIMMATGFWFCGFVLFGNPK